MQRKQTIAELREERKLTQAELAYKANVDAPSLSYMERGQIDTHLTELRRLAAVLGVSIDDVVLPEHERLLKIRSHYVLLTAHRAEAAGGRWRARVLQWDHREAREQFASGGLSPSMMLSNDDDEWKAIGESADEALTKLSERIMPELERSLSANG